MYDLIVLGGGPAGYLAAERAGHEGLNVLCIEKEHLGGVCLNEGCIPTKTLLYSAKTYENALHGDKYGVTVEKAALEERIVIPLFERTTQSLMHEWVVYDFNDPANVRYWLCDIDTSLR